MDMDPQTLTATAAEAGREAPSRAALTEALFTASWRASATGERQSILGHEGRGLARWAREQIEALGGGRLALTTLRLTLPPPYALERGGEQVVASWDTLAPPFAGE